MDRIKKTAIEFINEKFLQDESDAKGNKKPITEDIILKWLIEFGGKLTQPLEVKDEISETGDIDVWRIEVKGLNSSHYYEINIKTIPDMLKNCDYDEGYIITKHKMKAEEYRTLPEFTGF